MPSIKEQQLRLTDSSDSYRAVSWKVGGARVPLLSGRLVVRATEAEDDSVDPLIDIAADITDDVATAVIPKAAIQAADFGALEPGQIPVWEFVIVRDDGLALSAIGGEVVWTRGVARP
jgi:hypothetical protein